MPKLPKIAEIKNKIMNHEGREGEKPTLMAKS